MVLVIGSVVAQQARIAEALALSQDHVARSRLEPGCISHAVHQDSENALRLVFVEKWADVDALRDHFKVPASRAFVRSLSALVQEPPEMAIYEAAEIKVP